MTCCKFIDCCISLNKAYCTASNLSALSPRSAARPDGAEKTIWVQGFPATFVRMDLQHMLLNFGARHARIFYAPDGSSKCCGVVLLQSSAAVRFSIESEKV